MARYILNSTAFTKLDDPPGIVENISGFKVEIYTSPTYTSGLTLYPYQSMPYTVPIWASRAKGEQGTAVVATLPYTGASTLSGGTTTGITTDGGCCCGGGTQITVPAVITIPGGCGCSTPAVTIPSGCDTDCQCGNTDCCVVDTVTLHGGNCCGGVQSCAVPQASIINIYCGCNGESKSETVATCDCEDEGPEGILSELDKFFADKTATLNGGS